MFEFKKVKKQVRKFKKSKNWTSAIFKLRNIDRSKFRPTPENLLQIYLLQL